MKAASVVAAALALLLLPGVVAAQVPGVMSFQGRILKSDGTPETGSPDVTFSIYAAAEGGDPVWQESQTVALTSGFYAVKLGARTAFPASLFDGKALWIGVKVGLGEELKPRQYIASVPYAFKAGVADKATTATTATTAKTATGGVVGGVMLGCGAGTSELRGCNKWGAASCPPGDCNSGVTCSKGSPVLTSESYCWAGNGNDGYCYSYLCIVQ